jgi:hypothetical protein
MKPVKVKPILFIILNILTFPIFILFVDLMLTYNLFALRLRQDINREFYLVKLFEDFFN